MGPDTHPLAMTMAATNHWSAIFKAIVIVLIGLMIAHPAFGQAEDEELTDEVEELDEPEIDVQGSIDVADEQRGVKLDGDLRLGYVSPVRISGQWSQRQRPFSFSLAAAVGLGYLGTIQGGRYGVRNLLSHRMRS